MNVDATRILTRAVENPILDYKDFPGVAQLYNPSPIMNGTETILFISVITHLTANEGRNVGQTRLARSRDGIHFELEEDVFIKMPDRYPFNQMRHFIDNRVTMIDGVCYIVTPAMIDNFDCPVGVLGKTTDFKSYETLGVITQPHNRGASLFPGKVNGKYWKLDRPNGEQSGDIWISSSPDLLHWGDFQPLLKAGYRFWNMCKMGPTPPLWTPEGYLVIMHGVFAPAGGIAYYIGAMLLDLEDPTRIIGKTNSYLLAPEAPYERNGNCDNCVFPCGAIADLELDRLRLYYGAADCRIGLASGKLSEVIDACQRGI